MRRLKVLLAVSLVLGVIGALLYASGIRVEPLLTWLQAHEQLTLPFAYMSAEFLATLIPPVPNPVTAVLGGYLFGPVLGALFTLLPAMLASTLLFLLARSGRRVFLERFLRSQREVRIVTTFIERGQGLYSIIFVRLSPLFPQDILTIALGFTDISFWSFFFPTLIGYTVSLFTLSYVGALIQQAGGEVSLVRVLPFIAALTALSVIGVLATSWTYLKGKAPALKTRIKRGVARLRIRGQRA
ncbi:TVP38/TMEM64 family protein [Candidatus Woesearchaeota archaeon]|nr:TVP38/TMEM64 family protein [Candidatus Woesearchaeota archaeon]